MKGISCDSKRSFESVWEACIAAAPYHPCTVVTQGMHCAGLFCCVVKDIQQTEHSTAFWQHCDCRQAPFAGLHAAAHCSQYHMHRLSIKCPSSALYVFSMDHIALTHLCSGLSVNAGRV